MVAGQRLITKAFHISLIFLTVFCSSISSKTINSKTPQDPPMKIVLIDTTGRDKWLYKPFIDILETVGWQVDYRSIDQLMDLGPKRLNLPNYKAAFFFFGFEFLKGANKSPVAAKIMLLMQQFCKLPNRLVGFIFPPLNTPANVNLVGGLSPIFNSIGVNTPREGLAFPNLDDVNLEPKQAQQKNIDAFFYVANTFLARPLETRPLDYHTTLNDPRPGQTFYTKEIERVLQTSDIYLKLLPLSQQFSPIIKQTFPYGLYWFNPLCNNHVFLGQSTIFSFSSISESFHLCPVDFVLRKEMNKAVQHMMWDVTLLVKALDREKNITTAKLIDLPQDITLPWSLSSLGNELEPDEQQAKTHKIAWMETTLFEEKHHDAKKNVQTIEQEKTQQTQQQDQLIDYILTAELDTLWISVTPNIYFSPIARHKNKTKTFLQGLGNFTQKLTSATQQKHRPLPQILIGFEIANNLYDPNLPQQCSVDLYGNLYQDLPAALDRSFWKNEIQTPLDKFLTHWNNSDISNGIPIAGIVLDLEMYGRKTSGEFLSSMGFDRISFSRFARRHHLHYKNMSPHEKSNLLMTNKQTSQYFSFLEQDAERLGSELKRFFNKKIPHCIIACYMPNIIINWFYKGLYKGLSNARLPLQLFTFNAEFQGHKTWFEANQLAVQHSSVLMLSKIKKPNDFTLVDSVLKHHHGIWLNRFSRMIEPKVNDWATIERPVIDESYYDSFCQHIAATP